MMAIVQTHGWKRFLPVTFAMFLVAALPTCTSPTEEEGTAEVGVSAQALTSADVTKVTLSVSGTGISPNIVRELVKTGGQWKGVIGGIPVGTNRTFLAEAFDAANAKIYEGQMTGVPITSGAPTGVTILLQQHTAPHPFVNSAPRIAGVTTSASQVAPNQSVSLSVTASDADAADTLKYAWTATGGTLANANTATPTWTASAASGNHTLSVTVSDGRGGQAGVSLTIAVVQASSSSNVSVSFNAWPVASQVVGTPFGQVAPGGVVNLDVTAADPDNDPITYGWADGGCGGSFSNVSIKSPVWTAPATAPANGVCRVTVTVTDNRQGSTTGQLGINVGTPSVPNGVPVIAGTFQSSQSVLAGETVNLALSAYDPEGGAITFAWSASGGTVGKPVSNASQSEVVWTAPASGGAFTISAMVKDGNGQQTLQNFTIDVISYAWTNGSWGACSTACGTGTQTRTVSCRRSDGVTMADSFCTGTRPATSQSCTGDSCTTYTWATGSWSSCSNDCGTGMQTRTVTCQRIQDGATVDESNCTGAKAAASQSCEVCAAECKYSCDFGSCPAVTRSTVQWGPQSNSPFNAGTTGYYYYWAESAYCWTTKPGCSRTCP
ncbi:MAG TPA: thrombospondin type-1 domain-containing protein [Archangium sp.]|uniref:thrombospondin type-1 domain-containing protein n=1 Tax=Archangium sp. TaxID=1872627 RepID=UPI002ED970C5